MGAATARTERIAARVTPKVYRTLRDAAELAGATINQFLLQAALEKAEAVIDREHTLHLSRRDAIKLLKLLERPPKPNPRLKRATHQYRKAKRGDADSGFDWAP